MSTDNKIRLLNVVLIIMFRVYDTHVQEFSFFQRLKFFSIRFKSREKFSTLICQCLNNYDNITFHSKRVRVILGRGSGRSVYVLIQFPRKVYAVPLPCAKSVF